MCAKLFVKEKKENKGSHYRKLESTFLDFVNKNKALHAGKKGSTPFRNSVK